MINSQRIPLEVKHYKVKIIKKKQNPIKYILSVLSYALFMFLLFIGIILLVYVADNKIRNLKGDNTPSKFNAYVVLTGSMLPEIKVYDVVVTKKVPAEELVEGDIITFLSSDERFYGQSITHRIKNIYIDANTKKYTYQTKGDNNNSVDWTLAEDDRVLGKVIFRIPKLGYVQFFLASKGGWIFAILLPSLAILSYDIMKLFKNITKKTNVVRK